MKKVFCLVASFILILSLLGCGSADKNTAYESMNFAGPSYSASDSNGGFYSKDSYDFVSEEYEESVSTTSQNTQNNINDSARKLIKTYNLDVETEEYDELLETLEERVKALKGYIQDMNSYNGSKYSKRVRSASITVRVPVNNLDEFIDFVGGASNITRKNISVEDITLQYVDTESRKAAYEIEQERLLALLEKTENINDMIVIEERLSQVRYELESQGSRLRTFDNLVDYATVYLSISEVEQYTAPEPEKYWDRVSRAFTNGLHNVGNGFKEFFVKFCGALPGLVTFIVIVLLAVFVISKISKIGSRKRIEKRELKAEELMNRAKETAKKKAEENEGKF